MHDFTSYAQKRTADVVEDIGLLTSQAWCWSKLPERKKKVVEDPQSEDFGKRICADDFKRFARFAIEEILRRG